MDETSAVAASAMSAQRLAVKKLLAIALRRRHNNDDPSRRIGQHHGSDKTHQRSAARAVAASH